MKKLLLPLLWTCFLFSMDPQEAEINPALNDDLGNIFNEMRQEREEHRIDVEMVDTNLLSIAGGVPSKIQEFIAMLKTPERYTRFGIALPNSILLYGPSGTGKTTIAKAIAGETERGFIWISSAELITAYQGSGATAVGGLFTRATDFISAKNEELRLAHQGPIENVPKFPGCVIFIDELDGVANEQISNSSEYQNTLYKIMKELDKVHPGIIFVAATNKQSNLPNTLKTRFNNFMVEVALPNKRARQAILEYYTQNRHPQFTADCLSKIADKAKDLSGRELEAIVKYACILAVRSNSENLTDELINKALYAMKNFSLNKLSRLEALKAYINTIEGEALSDEDFRLLAHETKGMEQKQFEKIVLKIAKIRRVCPSMSKTDASFVACYMLNDSIKPLVKFINCILKYLLLKLDTKVAIEIRDSLDTFLPAISHQFVDLKIKKIKEIITKSLQRSLFYNRSIISEDIYLELYKNSDLKINENEYIRIIIEEFFKTKQVAYDPIILLMAENNLKNQTFEKITDILTKVYIYISKKNKPILEQQDFLLIIFKNLQTNLICSSDLNIAFSYYLSKKPREIKENELSELLYRINQGLTCNDIKEIVKSAHDYAMKDRRKITIDILLHAIITRKVELKPTNMELVGKTATNVITFLEGVQNIRNAWREGTERAEAFDNWYSGRPSSSASRQKKNSEEDDTCIIS